MKKSLHLFPLLLFLLPLSLFSQIRLTEVAPTNNGQITDEDNDQPDWIEIQNGGTQIENLFGWSLSDGSGPNRWLLPETSLAPGARLLIFASGKNRGSGSMPAPLSDHWETALYDSDAWEYIVGDNPPPADWATDATNSSGWPLGNGGFGYSDGDDETEIPPGTITVYYRKTFWVEDTAQLAEAILNMDYDDGFVAYLNGQEIARSSNMAGVPTYTTLAVPDREATGLPPEEYKLDPLVLAALLQPGTNVLAVEIHNNAMNSSDMSGRTWLHFGIKSPTQYYGPLPSWFYPNGIPGSILHTDFKLNFSETVTLYNPAGDIADSVSIGLLQAAHSRMRLNDDGDWCTTPNPTPGGPNGSDCLNGYAEAPGILLAAGFYNGKQSVALAGTGEIRYSTDGSIPTENSELYSGAIEVSETTVLRARSFAAGKLPSAATTSTYFIDEPTTLTAVSVSLPPDDFQAVYDAHYRKGSVAVEYFDQERQRRFSGDFAGYVVGNWSVDFAQKSLQFDADEDYGGLSDIEYPVFAPDKPIPSFRSFRIRNEDDDFEKARMRDRIVNELAAETHAGRASYRNVAAFINGEYWGHYVARERLDEYFVRDNYGADPDSVNMVKTYYNLNTGGTEDVAEKGTLDDFYAMTNFIIDNDMSDASNFQQASQLLDLENFTDYMQTEIYVASTDWLQQYYNNIRLFKTEKNVPWKFLLWDVSYSSGNGTGTCSACNVLGSTLGNSSQYGQMLRSLLNNAAYHRYFINRFADLMNTSFLATRAHALIDNSAGELTPEIERHNERWGTGNFTQWSNSVQELRDFYSERAVNQRGHIIDNFQLDQEVNITLNVLPAGAGTVKISTVVPKQLPWTGVYFHGNPVTVTAIPNPGYSFDHWSNNSNIGNTANISFTADVAGNTTFIANFTGSAQTADLKISEINYHSDPTRDGGDWFEIRNGNSTPLDISDYIVQDQDWYHKLVIPTGTVIPANGHLVLASNPVKFSIEYPAVSNVLSIETGFELSDKNDAIHVYDRSGEELASAAYDDENPWPEIADGFGLTLERRDNSAAGDQPESWFAGCVGGSPGTFYSACVETTLLSEINYNSADDADAGDWIELHNAGTEALDLGGWQLRDESKDHVFILPQGTTIASDAYLVLYQDDAKFAAQFPAVGNKLGPIGFGFSGNSDVIRLYDAGEKLYLSMRYHDSAPWPTEPDGQGYTLEKTDAASLLNEASSWIKGCLGGSPGAAFDPTCGNSVNTVDVSESTIGMEARPNPAQDMLFVKTTLAANTVFYLSDVFGKTVAQQHSNNGEVLFRTAELARGVYFASAVSSGKKTVLKVILK